MRRAALDLVLIQTARVRPDTAPSALLDRAGLRIAAECRAAAEVGGDFYLVFPRGAGHVSVVIGDVCGRGNAGAELLALVLPTIEELVRDGFPPAQLLSEGDRRLAKLLPLDRFVTLAAFEIDTQAAEVTVANAGHVPALVRSGDEVRRIGHASGPPLGIGGAVYSEECVALAPDDVLVLMTDGLLEAIETDLIGMPKLECILSRAPDGAQAIHRTILAELDGTLGDRRPDDVTLLVVEVIGGSGARRLARPEMALLSSALGS